MDDYYNKYDDDIQRLYQTLPFSFVEHQNIMLKFSCRDKENEFQIPLIKHLNS